MSDDTDEALPADEYTTLRALMAQVKAPTIDVVEHASSLDAALLVAAAMERTAQATANDIVGALSQTLAVHLAANDAADALGQVAASITALQAQCTAVAVASRKKLAWAMDSAGAADTETSTHKASATTGPKKLVIEDEKKLPIDCIEHLPKPSAKLITAKLTAGLKVPGARLDSGEPSIRLSVKKVARGIAA